jgi:hypothetical protein
MGTRSVIARWNIDGEWEGRYVHWDGYPTSMMPLLEEIIARDGFATASRVLIDEHFGWSSINPDMAPKEQTEGHIVPLPGYGSYYTDSDNDPFIMKWAEVKECGAEYFYIITPDEITCYDSYGVAPEYTQPIEQQCIGHVYDSYCGRCGLALRDDEVTV